MSRGEDFIRSLIGPGDTMYRWSVRNGIELQPNAGGVNMSDTKREYLIRSLEKANVVNPAWSFNDDEYHPIPDIRESIPSGYYIASSNSKGDHLAPHSIHNDESYVFEDSSNKRILDDLDTFIGRRSFYEERGFAHKRGYLFVGPQGSGKSALVIQMSDRIIRDGGIVVFAKAGYTGAASSMLKFCKSVEPEKLVMCVLEDIDAIIEDDGESEILQLLDGSLQVSGIFFIATTNYPEKLPPRIINRPRRFDKVEEIGFPPEGVRRQYFKKKLPEVDDAEIDRITSATAGFSYAAMAEYIISTRCLGVSEEDTIANLEKIKRLTLSSEKFADTKKKSMGY